MKLLTQPTAVALWHGVVQEASLKSGTPLMQEVESYLVFLLMRYINRPEFIKRIIASQYLQSLKCIPSRRILILQEIGDQCLLFSGLYPHLAEKRLVKVSYFVNMGQSAYGTLAAMDNDLFASLAKQFVTLMDVLQSISQPTLLPLEAYDLWNESSSQRAFAFLKYTAKKGIPIKK